MNGLVFSRCYCGLGRTLVGLSFESRHPTKPRRIRSLLQTLKSIGTVVLYAAMLIAILALWNNNAPQFIYVAF